MKRVRGFTLIELMIAVVIVAILAAFAIPSYQQYVLRGHRSEGTALLSDAAARQERFFAQNNSYVTSQTNIGKLGLPNTSGTTVSSLTGRYTLSVSSATNDGGYTLTAAPQGPQLKDTACGSLILDATGKRGVGASGANVSDCWR
ncbi:MAG: type IV pilin protein [Spongiibacteraceae bacterium]|nr:type IV pilin protein [Spongiibacteraceae bacterium]